MHLILRYANGRRADALLLMLSADRMRLILHECNETLEYYRMSDRWVSEDGMRISIEAIVPATAEWLAGAPALALSAGGPASG